MLLAYTICTVMYGNGARMIGIAIIQVRRLMALPGSMNQDRKMEDE